MVVLLLAAALVTPAAGQRPYDAADGFVVHEPVSVTVARDSCLTRLLLGTVAPTDTLPCQVTEVVTMDTGDAWRWTMVRYRRGAIERFDGTVDTVDFDEVVLFGVDRDREVAVPVWHRLTEYAGDHWAVVEQSYLSELATRAPVGFALHWGRRIDLQTLTGEQPIATRQDANCCPSGLMRFAVWLDGRRLRLITAEVVKR